ncbi:hypothetical protein BVY04_00305 [bacterium M21]|nr:hypothetical protein BVY04_00305 [bacterium M21]
MAVEIWFTSKISYETYLKHLGELGYEKKDNKYIGLLKRGEFAGSEVEVKTGMAAVAGRRSKKLYTIQARCYAVLGKGVTLEKIQAAMKKGARKEDRW